MSYLSLTITTAELNGYFTKIAILLSIGLLACIVFIWRAQASRLNSYLVYILSVICIFIAFYLGLLSGTLADELNLGGSILPGLSVIALSIFTICFTFWRSASKKTRR